MPTADYLAGAAFFGAVAAAVALATALVVRRRLGHLDRLERAVAATVVGTGLLVAVHLVPLALGILSRASVLAAAAALALGTALAVRPLAAPAGPEARGRPRSDRASWALALGACAVAATAAAGATAGWAPRELVGVDALNFHLPGVAGWIQTGSLWHIDQWLPLLAYGNYPNTGDVVLLAAVLPWMNDFATRLLIVAFVPLTALAVAGVARELRAPPAAAMLAGALTVTITVVGVSPLAAALPDVVLYATFAGGVMFLLRHARSARRSDLVLAGLGLGLAFGTKWYGVSSVAALVVVWLVARLVRRDRLRLVAAEGGLVAGMIALVGGIWMVRNLVVSGNPVFPVRIAPFGVTIFDAPPDVLREQAGFSIADYAGRPDVLGQLALEVLAGIGPAVVVCTLGLALVPAARRADRRAIVVAGAALLLAGVYVVTPYTALGLAGQPELASVNTRYLVPALLLGAPVVAVAVGVMRRGARVVEAVLAVAVVVGATLAYESPSTTGQLQGAVLLALLGLGGWVAWRLRDTLRHRPAVAALAVCALLALVLAGGRVTAERVNDERYLGTDPALDWVLRNAPADRNIGLVGLWSVDGLSPVWPSFGTRLGNEVSYVGRFVDGLLRDYQRRDAFLRALRERDYDVLVVGQGLAPPQPTPAERWARAAGWRPVARSERLHVLVPADQVQTRQGAAPADHRSLSATASL